MPSMRRSGGSGLCGARRGWKPCVTGGSCLMRVMRDGRVIEVLWDPAKRKTRTSRYGMVLWYDFQIFERDKWF